MSDQFVLLSLDDWQVLYKNGKKVFETHSIWWRDGQDFGLAPNLKILPYDEELDTFCGTYGITPDTVDEINSPEWRKQFEKEEAPE